VLTLRENTVYVYRSKLSSGSCNGYDFTQFQTYFDEHRRLRAEEQLYELRRRMLTVTSAVSGSSVSLDSVPTGTATSSCHTARECLPDAVSASLMTGRASSL